jgi:hypothetical protein
MTSDTVNKFGNFGHLIYDSGNDTATGRKRIGTSATEIELLDDIRLKFPTTKTNNTAKTNEPASLIASRARNFETPASSKTGDRQKSPSSFFSAFQTLPKQHEQSQSTSFKQHTEDQELGSAVDKLLEKYAPE